MVAYSFKPAFISPIEAWEKRQTIRPPRKRHARVGELMQLFTGPRMRPIRLGDATCIAVRDVRLDFSHHTVTFDDAVSIDAADGFDALNEFAVRDGFRPRPDLGARTGVSPWEYMALWWRTTHPGQPIFRGVLIDWGESFRPRQEIPKARNPESLKGGVHGV